MPTVERVRLAYNNVYLVSDGKDLVVIDTGPDYRGARETLTSGLDGRTPRLVVATHGHLDHAGLGQWWQAEGVPVAAAAADLPQILGHTDADIDELEAYVESVGAPEEVVIDVNAGLEQRRAWAHEMRTRADWREPGDGRWPTALRYPAFEPQQVLEEGQSLACGLRIVLTPGHTPGNLVVVHEDEGWLFSGDQLLPEIMPTPAIQFHDGKRFASLPRFLDSLRRLPGLADHETCMPGHGEPFENVRQVVEENLAQAAERSARLLESLRSGGPATVYELAERTYPRALRRRFWQIISTIQGHLDVLAESGTARFANGHWSA
ncbi:MAG: MBL fold metallo-hydrolase [bacterium]